jgi:hypothetical protein
MTDGKQKPRRSCFTDTPKQALAGALPKSRKQQGTGEPKADHESSISLFDNRVYIINVLTSFVK